jgi:Type IV secretory pathway, VirD4 components
MVTVSSRQFTLGNKIPFVYFLDEATTFKIPDFEKLPSVLREYLCSFVFISQSGAKVERRYSKLERSSIEANFGNQFYGATKDVEALKNYPLIFGKFDKKKHSRTRGSGRGGESKSQTVSYQREERYDTNVFTNLKPGEFVGIAANANVKDFYMRFEQYDSSQEESITALRIVTERTVEENYRRILLDIERIV